MFPGNISTQNFIFVNQEKICGKTLRKIFQADNETESQNQLYPSEKTEAAIHWCST